ncbi:MAG TPA: lipopolysaccharide transport periplasmic protein LptA [Geopsychrobacteraceae bacterium]|nr:lipopolysaccharide transport periplasmic protein LptA [Geopsychrobacteraceae bacterium]
MIKPLLLLVFALLTATSPLTAWCAEIDTSKAASAVPVDISSESLEVDEQSGTAVFTGQVLVKRGDMTIYADTLTLHRAQNSEQIETIEASGGVRVVQLDRIATAQQANFYQQEEKLVLIGDAKIRQGQNLVAGEEITMFIKENRSLVKSGKDGRVRAVFFPEQGQ